MNCKKHGTPMNEVCGEHVCGTCYGERLMTEPVRRVKNGEPEYVLVRLVDVHGNVGKGPVVPVPVCRVPRRGKGDFTKNVTPLQMVVG